MVERLAASDEPAYGVSTGFGSLAQTPIPRRSPDRAAAGADPLARGRDGAAGRARGRPGDAVPARPLAGDGPLGRAAGARRDDARDARRRARPGRPRARLARGQRRPRAARRTARWRCSARARSSDADGEPIAAGAGARGGRDRPAGARRQGGPGADQRHRRDPRDAGPRARRPPRPAARRRRRRRGRRTEALLGTDRAFAADLVALRPQPGQADSAANLRRLLDGSAIVASHRDDDPRVQDAYSIRCTPQVHGAARDTLAHAERSPRHELGSAIDNPMVLPDGRVESCGNFHGAPVGVRLRLPRDRRRRGRRDRRAPHRPPARRTSAPTGCRRSSPRTPGVDSGLMIAQYTQAAMVAENRRLAAPASVDSLPTSAMQEDHVSMGWGAARKLRRCVDNLRRILAVELTCACRGARAARAARAGRRDRRRARRPLRADGPGRRARPLARAGARRGRGAARVGSRWSPRSRPRSESLL